VTNAAAKLVLIASIAYAINLHATDVYKVIDENGRAQYTQIPPYKDAQKVKLNKVNNNINSSQEDKTSLQERQKKYSDYLQSERLERKEKRLQAKQEKAQLASRCNSVRAELSDMNQGGILYYDLDENGERNYIDESIVEEKKNRLRTYLEKKC
tara:strand:+ start:534 stop:995 length:462 start_codon:yes stop_codon:yes gene_type:complete